MPARQGPVAGHTWVAPGCCLGPPCPHLLPLPLTLFSLLKKHGHKSLTRVFLCSCSRFSISLLSPLFLLRFGAFDFRYVTPLIIQVEFCLVEYFLSIFPS